jgi:hypothetical protein
LNQTRNIEDDVHSEPEEEEQIDDEEIDYESDQQDVVTTGYDQEEEWMNDDWTACYDKRSTMLSSLLGYFVWNYELVNYQISAMCV